jgi:hypothetical protein
MYVSTAAINISLLPHFVCLDQRAKPMTEHDLFVVLIAIHITTGAPGLIGFWIPVLAQKGGERHKWWGKIFSVLMLITGTVAMMMATLTLLYPMPTHPHLVDHPEFSDPVLVQGIFGWMMFYLGLLTVNLTWYGWRCAVNKRDQRKNQTALNWGLQAALLAASANCAIQGVLISQPMMIGISMVGFATVGTNVWFLVKSDPSPIEWLLEHIKAIVGTGISVYTAFFAFGAVRLMPELALAPGLWAIPLVTGLALIFYHRHKVTQRFTQRTARPRQRRSMDLDAAE